MSSKAIPHTLAAAIVIAVAASLLVGTALSGFAQVETESSESFSGTINSMVQETSEIIGGDWELSAEGNTVSDFTAELITATTDGAGAHTHRIVVAGEGVEFAEPGITQAGDVVVTLDPTEQNVGSTVLVNATGLVADNVTTVKVGDIVAGNPEADAEGNVLFALGVIDEMMGSQTVTVEDGSNSGSASLTVIEAVNETSTEPSNATTTESGNAAATGTTGESANQTGTQSGNLTGSQSADTDDTETGSSLTEPGTENTTEALPSSDQTVGGIYGTEILGELDNSTDASANLSTTDPATSNTTDLIPDDDLTTLDEDAMADEGDAMAEDESLEGTLDSGNMTSDTANETSTTGNATSDQEDPSDVEPTSEITTTFEVVADIYTGDQLAWEDIDITISILNGQVISIEIDPVATDNHFGDQPIFGFVES